MKNNGPFSSFSQLLFQDWTWRYNTAPYCKTLLSPFKGRLKKKGETDDEDKYILLHLAFKKHILMSGSGPCNAEI